MKKEFSLFILSASLVLGCLLAIDSLAGSSTEITRVQEIMMTELSHKFQNAKITILAEDIKKIFENDSKIKRVEYMSENSLGEARFKVTTDSENSEFQIKFKATVIGWVASKRIFPAEKLAPENFQTQEVEVSRGQGREYRGLILPITADLNKLESRQTFLEGQFLTTSGVQKIPDIKRGSVIKLRITAPGLDLSTTAIADESGSINDQIHVTIQKSKKQILGRITADQSIEVSL